MILVIPLNFSSGHDFTYTTSTKWIGIHGPQRMNPSDFINLSNVLFFDEILAKQPHRTRHRCTLNPVTSNGLWFSKAHERSQPSTEGKNEQEIIPRLSEFPSVSRSQEESDLRNMFPAK